MKITQLFLCVIVFCCIAVSKSTASMLTASTLTTSTLTTSMSQAALLKKHYYENHPRLFKEFEHQGKKIIVNKIANMPEIFNCGTPVDEGRIIKLTEAINTLFLNVEATFHSIKAFKKEYFGYSDEADEIVRSDISINTVRDMRAKLKDFDPITVNDIIAQLATIIDHISVNQKNISDYLKEISEQIKQIQVGLNETTASSVTGLVQRTSIQESLDKAQFLQGRQNALLSFLSELNSAKVIAQNALHLLTDFYLQTRSPEGGRSCPTDLYLSYLNNSTPYSDALTLDRDRDLN